MYSSNTQIKSQLRFNPLWPQIRKNGENLWIIRTLIIIEVPAAASKLIMVVNSKKMMPLVAKAYCWKKLQMKSGDFEVKMCPIDEIWLDINSQISIFTQAFCDGNWWSPWDVASIESDLPKTIHFGDLNMTYFIDGREKCCFQFWETYFFSLEKTSPDIVQKISRRLDDPDKKNCTFCSSRFFEQYWVPWSWFYVGIQLTIVVRRYCSNGVSNDGLGRSNVSHSDKIFLHSSFCILPLRKCKVLIPSTLSNKRISCQL